MAREAVIWPVVRRVTWALLILAASSAAARADGPVAAVEGFLRDALAALVEQRAQIAADPDHAERLIHELALPRVDTERTARFVLGAAWGTATAGERERFHGAFTRHTIATYGVILHRYADEAARLAEQVAVRTELLRREGDRAVVRAFFGFEDRPERAVDVYLHAVDGRWQVFDVQFAGISLLQGWRSDIRARLERQPLNALIAALEQRHPAHSRSSPGNRDREPADRQGPAER